MGKSLTIISLALIFVLFTSIVHAKDKEEDISIRVHFFKGAWLEDSASVLKQMAVLSVSSHPELASLKEKIDGQESEFKAALIETLLDMMDLKTLEDLGLFKKSWRGKNDTLLVRLADKGVGCLYRCKPRWFSPGKLAIQVTFFRSKEIPLQEGMKREEELQKILDTTYQEDLMEKILEKEFFLESNEPIIVGIPYESQAYFLMISWTGARTGMKSEVSAEAETPYEAVALKAPKLIQQVLPAYPKELRQQGVKGEVKFRLLIDKKGTVKDVDVVKSLHPYLDYAAAKAFMQWKFEPGLKEGKPVQVTSVFTFIFDPKKYSLIEQAAEAEEKSRTGMEPYPRDKLQRILERSAEYCQRLSDSALDFVCEENIKEIHYYLNTERKVGGFSILRGGWGRNADGRKFYRGTISKYRVMDPTRIERARYICDYQLIKKGDQIEERRIILKENGRKITEQVKLLEEKRFSVLRPLFAAVKILGRDRQSLFYYRIIEEDNIGWKKAYVIEAVPKFGDTGIVEYAKIWVDKKRFQILKCEIKGVPFEGYDDVWEEATLANIKPESTIKHIYRVEKKGVMFPSHSTVRIEYPELDPQGPITKLKINMFYEKYKFFTVETDYKVIK